MKLISTNRRARHDYDLMESFEAGIELRGMEVKSLRTRGCSIDESFARLERGEIFLYNAHIPEFSKSSYFRPDPRRSRKLLLKKKEIKRLLGLTTQKSLTIVPVKIYFNERGLAKVQIALAKGRKKFDKRKKIREELANKEAQSHLRRYQKGR